MKETVSRSVAGPCAFCESAMLHYPLLYLVRRPAVLTPENQQDYLLVGVRCPRCPVVYSVAIPSSAENADAIPKALRWAEARMGACGAHLPVLYEEA